MLSIKSVNALSHYTDWIIAHVHGGALGWNGFLTFGMIYWLLPRLFQTKLYSKKLAEVHFWLAHLRHRALRRRDLHRRAHAGPDVARVRRDRAPAVPGLHRDHDDSSCRCTGCAPSAARSTSSGMLIFGCNILMTWQARPAGLRGAGASQAPPLRARTKPRDAGRARPRRAGAAWATLHRRSAGTAAGRACRCTFTVLVVVAVVVASLFEILPTFLIRSNVPTIASVKPYTPLELAGRDIYIREGCYNCHSQMIRPFRHETERYGEYSQAGRVRLRPPVPVGLAPHRPDLAREGGKYPDLWHVRHMENPRAIIAAVDHAGVPAPADATPLDFGGIQKRVDAMAMLGVPYGDAVTGRAPSMARAQAGEVAAAHRRAGRARPGSRTRRSSR